MPGSCDGERVGGASGRRGEANLWDGGVRGCGVGEVTLHIRGRMLLLGFNAQTKDFTGHFQG